MKLSCRPAPAPSRRYDASARRARGARPDRPRPHATPAASSRAGRRGGGRGRDDRPSASPCGGRRVAGACRRTPSRTSGPDAVAARPDRRTEDRLDVGRFDAERRRADARAPPRARRPRRRASPRARRRPRRRVGASRSAGTQSAVTTPTRDAARGAVTTPSASGAPASSAVTTRVAVHLPHRRDR